MKLNVFFLELFQIHLFFRIRLLRALPYSSLFPDMTATINSVDSKPQISSHNLSFKERSVTSVLVPFCQNLLWHLQNCWSAAAYSNWSTSTGTVEDWELCMETVCKKFLVNASFLGGKKIIICYFYETQRVRINLHETSMHWICSIIDKRKYCRRNKIHAFSNVFLTDNGSYSSTNPNSIKQWPSFTSPNKPTLVKAVILEY